jgi:hypothetical protein
MIRRVLSIGRGNERNREPTMPRSELAAALALALIICACPAFASSAGAEQSASLPASQSATLPTSQPVSDAGNANPAEAQDRADWIGDAEALRNLKETDRLMRWLNESALWTGTSERTRARSIRFR